jgi:hypothetical protein
LLWPQLRYSWVAFGLLLFQVSQLKLWREESGRSALHFAHAEVWILRLALFPRGLSQGRHKVGGNNCPQVAGSAPIFAFSYLRKKHEAESPKACLVPMKIVLKTQCVRLCKPKNYVSTLQRSHRLS